ncbi:discoidin domain-containing protein [Paenibacillus sp. SC116]|uniref:discoidin domain-containing protein n=1 Tax=Paenibacillus sp. SC116 TaxID=2968986 RepID=UPI00215B20E8|nr:discoidin domain-containing protein [Paenibacillus sp. SC116]MCR8843296.1 discoidin domain-containing protein [Paenibacillus sp. SC116]
MNVNHMHYYKYRYINCFKAQYLAELLDKGIPVDYLFFDAYVDTDDILEDIIVNGLDRWTMRVKTLGDLGYVGLYILHRYFPTMSSAYPYVKEKLAANKTLYMWASQNHLPHLAHLPNGVHVIGLQSYSDEDRTFTIFDVPGIWGHSYEEIHIQNAFNHLEETFKYIYYLYDEDYIFTEEIVEILIRKFEDSFLLVNENLKLYDRMNELFQLHKDNQDDQLTYYHRMENALAVIAGSRYFFAKFLKIIHYPAVAQLEEIIKHADSLQKVFMKAKVGANINNYKVEDKLLLLKSLEIETISKIKQLIVQNREKREHREGVSVKTRATITDIGLTCKMLDLNKVKLDWIEVIQEDYLYSYEIYVNDTLYGTTLLNTYEITNLAYDSCLEIRIQVNNFSGYIEQCNDRVTIQTGYKDTNCALGKPVTCSSEETSIFTKENVNDGVEGTRWGSVVGSDNEWICIDLLEQTEIQRVVLNWESHAQSYTIDVSDDNVTWQTIITNDNGAGGVEEFNNLKDIKCRYIKMNGRKRGTTWGYSLWDFEVYAV